MKVNSLTDLPNVIDHKKISNRFVFPDNYDKVEPADLVSSFYDLIRNVIKRYEENSEVIRTADLKTQDLLHEAELLSPVNACDGYMFYRKVREIRQKRRIAKSENISLQPLYTYLNAHPNFLREMQGLRDACASADIRISNLEYSYRIQE